VFQKESGASSLLPMFDEREDDVSPGIDQNSSPKERVKTKPWNKWQSDAKLSPSLAIHLFFRSTKISP
jgi:hypothetical protein